jgi:pyruvate dehydrogenase E2 component (dihydrolipoamide acetyltransferase)
MPIEILMPALSPTMTEGNLAKWNKKEGDKIKAGDVIAEIETDKATMEVEAVDEGVLGKIVIAGGAAGVKVNQVIALLLKDGEDKSVLDSYKIATPEVEEKAATPTANENKTASTAPTAAPSIAPTATKAPVASAPTSAPKTTSYTLSTSNERVKASPLAKRIASESGVDLGAVKGSGPKGRVVADDISDFLMSGNNGVIRRNPVEFETKNNTLMRQVIARRLTESKQQVPHFYLTLDCALDKLLDAREQINAAAPKDLNGKPLYRVSVNDMIIKASALALKKVPEANGSWYDDATVTYNNVDISVAVAIEGGLITPIIRNADQKSLVQISNEMKELAAKARAGKLQPEEYTGGGFSISNLGMFGIKQFNAIINPPQSCILAVGAGEERVVVKNGKFEVANVMSVTLSADHRVVDGAVGATLLQAFQNFIENPVSMLV